MLFRKIIAVYYDSHTEHRDTLCRLNADLYYVKAGDIYSNYCV
jgi:hypothetical protein